MGEDGK
jgi:hypothetical protein